MPLVPLLTNSGPGAPLYAAAGTGGGGGGGGGPNLAVSTLSVAPTGSITLDYVAYPQNTSLTFNANSNGNSANILLNIDNGSLPSGAVNGGNPQQTTFLEQTNGTFIADAAFLALRGVNYVNYGSGFPGQTTGTIFSAANELRVDGAYPVNFHTPGVSISSLSVSSINGASPGGGGGPVPADLAVSTLTAASTITAGSTIQGLAYTAPAITGGGTYLKLGQGSPNQTSLFDVFSNNNDLDMRVNILGFNSGTAAAVGINIFTDEANSRAKIQPQSGSKIVLDAWEIINVSTINGVAPGGGGGGPPPAATSTILALTNLSSINDGTPQLLLVAGDVGITGGYLAAPAISTNTITPLTTPDLTLDATSTIIKGPAFISQDLNVSSINGLAPGGGSALQFSTLKIPGGAGTSTFVCDPAVANVLVSFSTIAGHVYSATTYARAQVFEAATNGQVVYTEILDDNTGNDPIGNWPAQAISTLSGGSGYQQVGGSVMWKAGGTGAAFCVVPDVSTLVRVDGINLMDFGAV